MTSEQPEITFIEHFIADADALFQTVVAQTTWDDRMQRRLTASFGAPYNYSNMTYSAVPMPEHLSNVCDLIQQKVGFRPDNCLINRYLDGSSTMGFHADSLEELVPQTGVAIISLGDTRTF